MSHLDLLVVGAGPGGIATAVAARRHGLEVLVVDNQAEPGGQIWRSVETAALRDDILGRSHVEGRRVVEAFRASDVSYQPGAELWRIEPGFRAFLSRDSRAYVIEAKAVILATGAQERPIPFPGWTLPGVLTVGAAQILLKNAGQIPAGPLWIAGTGPLPLLYAVQVLRAGGQIAGYLDTTPIGQWRGALAHLPRALYASTDLFKGLGWMATLRASKTPVIAGVSEIEALGVERVRALRYRTAKGTTAAVDAETVLVHEGLVPNIHAALSLKCAVGWNATQDCHAPMVDSWGESSLADLFIVGDAAGIAGAKAAQMRGELAALRVAVKLGHLREHLAAIAARPIRQKLTRELALRSFLDALYRPRDQVFAPSDKTIVCRCEEVTAGEIRAAAAVGRPGPNQVKTATRAGMGPCQGRQCGYTVTRIIGATQSRPPSEVGFFHIRTPLTPVTLSELASLDRGAYPYLRE